MTRNEHIAANRQQIEAAAREYAKNYGVSLEKARMDVEGEYGQGWQEYQDGRIYGDYE